MHQHTEIIGRLGATPKLSHTKSGKAVTTLRVATEAKKGETVWFSVVLWEKTAEYACQHAQKGTLVLCAGRMREETYKEVTRLTLHPEPFGFRILSDGLPREAKDDLNLD